MNVRKFKENHEFASLLPDQKWKPQFIKELTDLKIGCAQLSSEFGIDDETNGDEANQNVESLTMEEIDEILVYIGARSRFFLLVFRVLLDQDWRWRRRKSIPVIKVRASFSFRVSEWWIVREYHFRGRGCETSIVLKTFETCHKSCLRHSRYTWPTDFLGLLLP